MLRLAAKTPRFRERIERGEALEDLVFEAYAAVREAFKRTMGIRLFDVQLMGGIVLHEGDIAEMKWVKEDLRRGPASVSECARRLERHLVTVNDYLAKRDAEWTRPVWEALGVGSASSRT